MKKIIKPQHDCKSWSHFFDAIVKGDKKHDLRYDTDRNFKVGDIILLKRYDNINGRYTGDVQMVRVTYITSKQTPCAFSSAVLDNEYAILSLELVND